MSALHERAVLDTSGVIRLGEVNDPSSLPERLLITTITVAELAAGPRLAKTPTQRAAREVHLRDAKALFERLPFDDPAADAFAHVSADLHRQSRKSQARSYDALIAAVAIANTLPIYTFNPKHFSGIHSLEVVDLALAT